MTSEMNLLLPGGGMVQNHFGASEIFKKSLIFGFSSILLLLIILFEIWGLKIDGML